MTQASRSAEIFNINVTATNEAPEPVSGLNTSLTVDEGESVNASVSAVDPEGSNVTYAFDGTILPTNGSLEWISQSSGTFTYTHDDSDTTYRYIRNQCQRPSK